MVMVKFVMEIDLGVILKLSAVAIIEILSFSHFSGGQSPELSQNRSF